MNAVIISGTEVSERIAIEQAKRVAALREMGIVPQIAFVSVGENVASRVYLRSKRRACEALGVLSLAVHLPDATQEELHAVIDELNEDPTVHGILIQLPLPRTLDPKQAIARVLPQKDVDGFHPLNMGRLLAGASSVMPCTPRGIVTLLKSAGVPLDGAHAVIVGRSAIVGKPLALLLLQENCTVTVCHTHTRDLAALTQQADILIVAAGSPSLITASMVKPGAAVVDVGMNRAEGKLCGDVDFEAVRHVAGWLTPVPGGVGPMTVRMLIENTLEAVCRS